MCLWQFATIYKKKNKKKCLYRKVTDNTQHMCHMEYCDIDPANDFSEKE